MESHVTVVSIFLGGGLGAVFRFIISSFVNLKSNQIWVGTTIVNILGCLLFFLVVKYLGNTKFSQDFLRIGLLGSLTTFSTFSFESYSLLASSRYIEAIFVILLNILSGIVIGWLVLNGEVV